ncbi:helix-turn-helix transcriptional regulator [Streptomyces xanthophaeus]|uniref:helix-turn-helix transcriptional regulator n=1 Tax=Streptomyces xanthophaeus TaxID=67385 RepID=UPI00264A39B7|nr:LuxR family transcriptional regulator [Streptomyces xanthophaeus]WKD34116.1 LuxR C-terminal-related transcriptional regulator [Streptomyces xanthophaeus]
MLELLGLDAEAERVYRALLAHPKDGVTALAQRLELPESGLRACLDRLSGLALVQPSAQEGIGFRALNPEDAMELLLARQQAELATHQQKVEASRAAAAQLIAECSAMRPRGATAGAESLQGPEEIRDRLARLAANTRHEIMTFAPGGAHSAADLEASRGPNAALLDRGITMRTVYLDSVRNHQPTLDHVDWLHRHGGQVRTAPTLPVRMIISDRREVVLPLDTNDAQTGAVVLTYEGTIAALCALFESVWQSANPLGTAVERNMDGLTRQHRESLHLLLQGLTDEAIAKRLGVSPRTARRIAAELMEALEARSRFQAGAHAVQNGWLPATRV